VSRRSLASCLVSGPLSVQVCLSIQTTGLTTAWANYCTYAAAYVVPILGQVKLQALTPVQLNHLYAHLLERGRRKANWRGCAGSTWTSTTRPSRR
jgi:hypothetical protein